MIRLTRPKSSLAIRKKLREETRILSNQVQSRYKRIDFRPRIWNEIAPLFLEAQGFKCAYCESRIDSLEGVSIDHHRPKLGAINKDGSVDPDHYWWLAYEWSNFLVTCKTCGANKGSHFPVKTRRLSKNVSSDREAPLILNPYDDEPDRHLSFQNNGTVKATSVEGAETIKLLGLNRPTLIDLRRDRVKVVWDILLSLQKMVPDAHQTAAHYDFLEKVLSPVSDFSAAVRHSMARWGKKNPREYQVLAERLFPYSTPVAPNDGKADVTTSDSARTVLVTSIKITNFRAIDNVELTLKPPEGGSASWLTLLGENGAGKSSVLQAMALALLGKAGVNQLYNEIPGFSTDSLIKEGTDSATVKLELSSDPNKITLTLNKGKRPTFWRGKEGVPSMVLAYGAIRLMPRASDPQPVSSKNRPDHRIANLFDPYKSLVNAEEWLCSLGDEEFKQASWTLRDLLQINHIESPFVRENGQVSLKHRDKPVTLDSLSAGYKSIVALGADIMQASPQGILDKIQVTGIVMIDEIDIHLHPRWKMKVVSLLRSSFPSLQFLVTTHEPLALRGCKANEVVLMDDTSGHISLITDLPDPEGLRIDQLLTSRFFGLHSTIDPDVETRFNRYYELLGEDPPSSDHNVELDGLKKWVRSFGVLGYTRRDQLAYECIDDYLAREKKGLGGPAYLQETITDVAEMFERVERWQEGRS
ncbi:MAG: AAA family ATPase [Chlorobia bacterium]|nr:AAA family ATPase [Fimbriimonadaceae bacterium]